jgi:hypothetical protein
MKIILGHIFIKQNSRKKVCQKFIHVRIQILSKIFRTRNTALNNRSIFYRMLTWVFLDMASLNLTDSGIFDAASSLMEPPDIVKSTLDKVGNFLCVTKPRSGFRFSCDCA